jgi:Iron-sulfur cluster assembly accessory protein
MVALTEAARTVVRRLISENDSGATGLRIMVEQGGCAGLQYMLGLESSAQSGDEVYDFEGVQVFVDSLSLPIVHGMRIDFVETVEATGFTFDNPNATGTCSCGKSFSS